MDQILPQPPAEAADELAEEDRALVRLLRGTTAAGRFLHGCLSQDAQAALAGAGRAPIRAGRAGVNALLRRDALLYDETTLPEVRLGRRGPSGS